MSVINLIVKVIKRVERQFPSFTSSFMLVSNLGSNHSSVLVYPYVLSSLLEQVSWLTLPEKCRHGNDERWKSIECHFHHFTGVFLPYSFSFHSFIFLPFILLFRYWGNMKLVQVREMVVKIFLERSLGMQAVLFLRHFLSLHSVITFVFSFLERGKREESEKCNSFQKEDTKLGTMICSWILWYFWDMNRTGG